MTSGYMVIASQSNGKVEGGESGLTSGYVVLAIQIMSKIVG